MSDRPPFAAHVRRVRVFLYLLISLGFTALGIWLIGDHDVSESRRGFWLNPTVWGWGSVLFFGLGSVILIKLLVMRGPSLLIEQQGVTLQWLAGGPYGPIPWSYIDQCEMQTMPAGHKVLRVYLTDPGQTQALLGKRPSLIGRSNVKPLLEMPDIQLNKDWSAIKAAFVAISPDDSPPV